MTTTTHPETYVPTDEEHKQLLDLMHALEASNKPGALPALVVSDIERHELTPQLARLLSQVVRALSDGQAVTVVPLHRLLTTQEAADLLGVSRPTLIKILEREQLPHEKVGRHRRIQLADLLAYQDRQRAEQRRALDQLAEESQRDRLYDLLDGPPEQAS
jgi:excisionase family DNA binding protein